MSDYLHLYDNNADSNYAVSMFARKLVAFFPRDGFAVFEGYCHLKQAELPYTVTAYATKNIGTKSTVGVFRIYITEVFKKVIASPSWKKKEVCNCQPSSECECFISFFPSNIIILKFTTDDEKELNWNMTVDPKFTLERYMNLVDDPGYDKSYKPGNQEFYDEYHKFIENG
jgi:hypothetical protein